MDDQSQNQAKQSQPSQPTAPVSTPLKEQEPVSSPGLTSEYVQPTEREPALHPEVEQAGVEVVEQPSIPTSAQQVGVQPAKESVPVKTEPSGAVELLREIEAKDGQKKDSGNSVRWLYVLLAKIVKQLKFGRQ